MKKRKLTATQETIARLRAWRDRLRGGGKNRRTRDTSLNAPFSKNAAKGSKPQPQEEEVND